MGPFYVQRLVLTPFRTAAVKAKTHDQRVKQPAFLVVASVGVGTSLQKADTAAQLILKPFESLERIQSFRVNGADDNTVRCAPERALVGETPITQATHMHLDLFREDGPRQCSLFAAPNRHLR